MVGWKWSCDLDGCDITLPSDIYSIGPQGRGKRAKLGRSFTILLKWADGVLQADIDRTLEMHTREHFQRFSRKAPPTPLNCRVVSGRRLTSLNSCRATY